MPFFVNNNPDTHLPVVIEGEVVEVSTGPNVPNMVRVLKPEAFKGSWPSVSLHYFQQVSDEAGPARMLRDDDELVQVVKKYCIPNPEKY